MAPDYILTLGLADSFHIAMRSGEAEPPAYRVISHPISDRRLANRVLDEVTRLRPDQYRVAQQFLFERPSR